VGISAVLKFQLRRRRLFLAKVTLLKKNFQYLQANALFLPRIKKKPKPESFGRFARFAVTRQYN
jgi:hypothetical protein